MSHTRKEPSDEGTQEDIRTARLLNLSQHRALAATLRRLELATWRLEEQLTRGTLPQLRLTHVTNNLTAQQQTQLLRLAKEIRQEIAQLAKDYEIASEESNMMRTIASEFTLLWCDLEEIRPTNLRRYGTLNPRANDLLGPPIQHLIDLTLAIDRVASNQEETQTRGTVGKQTPTESK